MPYILKLFRENALVTPLSAGELNYQLTMSIIGYLERKGLDYQAINDIVGALDSVKAEFQRRIVAPYEDKKIVENGDVYPLR